MLNLDSMTLKALFDEQKYFVQSSRIVKIQQPSRTEFLLSLRNLGQTKTLYININPQFYHLCFAGEATKQRLKIPKQPPMFCMLLRKYIENAKISDFKQIENERIIEIYTESYNELNEKIYLCLCIELMGKHSNVILYNTDTGIILGCAHNVGNDKSSVREVYGGIPYIYPPSNPSKLKSFKILKDEIDIKNFNTLNEALENYFSTQISLTNFKSIKNSLTIKINKNLKKLNNTLDKLNRQLQADNNFDKYRLYADLLMANIFNLKDYSPVADVYDYENNKQISIKLDPTKTIKDNANKFYKKYNKGKISNEKSRELIENYDAQKEYNEQLLYFINSTKDIDTLNEIIQEMTPTTQNKQKSADKKINIETINIDENTRIYIGKNNKQNDYIVSKLASDDDLWFHTHNCAGSHVLLKTQNVTDELILRCAKLAKEYSTAKNSTKVGVIYTKRKYLKKPPASPLGYVTYKNESEIVVN